MAFGQDDDDDTMLAALTKSRLADDTEGTEIAAVAKAKAKAAALQPGKRFQPPDTNAPSKKPRGKAPKQSTGGAAAPAGAAPASTPSTAVVRQPKGNSNAAASGADIKKYLDMCDILKVIGAQTSRMDLYQCKRALASLEKKRVAWRSKQAGHEAASSHFCPHLDAYWSCEAWAWPDSGQATLSPYDTSTIRRMQMC